MAELKGILYLLCMAELKGKLYLLCTAELKGIPYLLCMAELKGILYLPWQSSIREYFSFCTLTFNYQAELLSYTLQTKQNLPNRGLSGVD